MSTELTAAGILAASRYYTIYVGFIILFGGIVGHTIDILVFTSSRPFRRNPSAFYFTAESIVNCIQLLISLTARLAMSGFDNDLTRTSLVWCKVKNFIGSSCTLLSLTIVCFAAINQYLSTNFQSYLKQLSTLKLAHCLMCTAIVVWSLHGLLFLVFMNNQTESGCVMSNNGLVAYVAYVYYPILTGLLPIVVASVFATLAYSNVRRIVRSQIPIVRRRLDRQLSAMMLVRVVFLVAATLPFVIYRIYSLKAQAYNNDPISRAIVDLVGAITICMFYFNYSGSFYLFLLSSERFRRQVKYVLMKKYWRMYCQKASRGNRITPVSHISSVELD